MGNSSSNFFLERLANHQPRGRAKHRTKNILSTLLAMVRLSHSDTPDDLKKVIEEPRCRHPKTSKRARWSTEIDTCRRECSKRGFRTSGSGPSRHFDAA
jgi:hypothetical protein